jgi:hypothetical protein
MTLPSLRHATYSALLTSVIFCLLFQLSKNAAIQNVAPLSNDPYDAVASFSFQIALAIALLSLARLASIKDEQGLRQRAIFILHGILLVIACVVITLVVDFIAMAQAWPLAWSDSMVYIFSGLTLQSLLTTITGILLVKAWRKFGNLPTLKTSDALAQAIGDCWTLVTVIATWLVLHLTFLKPVWNWIDSLAHRTAAAWNDRLPFANPFTHPWIFALAFAVLLGFMVMGIILISERIKEGGPATFMIGFLLAGIFFGGETIAILLSFLFIGGYLGLRPQLNEPGGARP